MNTTLFADPTTALLLARLHQDDVRRSFPRRSRRRPGARTGTLTATVPEAQPRTRGVTSVPALPSAVEPPAVVVPSPRSEADTRIAS